MSNVNRDPFVATQQVWLIDTDRIEIDKIQSSLSPDVLQLNSFDSAVDTIYNRLQGSNDSYGTLIITQNLSSSFKEVWSNFVKALNSLLESDTFKNRLFVFEINPSSSGEHVFINSVLCTDVDDFLMKAHHVHFSSVTDNEQVDEEAKKIIKQLQIENAKQKGNFENEKKEKEKTAEKLKETENKLSLLQSQIKSYENQAKKGLEAEEAANELIEKNKQKLKALQKQVDDLNKEVIDGKDTKTNLEIELEATKKYLSERNASLTSITQELRDTKDELEQLNKRQKEILNAKGEMKQNSILLEELEAQRQKTIDEHKQKLELNQQLSLQKLTINDLNKQIEDIRKGYKNVNRIGYSNNFGTIKLQQTNLMYFKIINPLPYHRFYLLQLQKMLSKLFYEDEDSPSKKVKIIFHKIDFGQDKVIIGDYPLIGNLSVATDEYDKYRIMPSLDIDEDHGNFDNPDKILIFVDYIQNDKYYCVSDAISDYYVIANNSSTISEMPNLKGDLICYDRSSLVDLRYNSQVENMTETNKNQFYLNNLKQLITSSNAIKTQLSR